jgi:hypothetical protein
MARLSRTSARVNSSSNDSTGRSDEVECALPAPPRPE